MLFSLEQRGDSLGLPAENLSPWRIEKRWPGPWTQRFVFGRGMVSDDTEHTVFVAQCLAEGAWTHHLFNGSWRGNSAGGCFAFQQVSVLPPCVPFSNSGWGFRHPTAGSFLLAIVRPCEVHLSALILRVTVVQMTLDHVRASTHLTHTDPKAETAALAMALTVSWSDNGFRPEEHLHEIQELWISAGPDDADWIELLQRIRQRYDGHLTVVEFAQGLGLKEGVTGYAYHTVPVALYAWLRYYGDYRAGLEAVLNCGGDTDTVGAITGALLAINSPIPEAWSTGLYDYPISRTYLEQLSHALEPHSDSNTVFPFTVR